MEALMDTSRFITYEESLGHSGETIRGYSIDLANLQAFLAEAGISALEMNRRHARAYIERLVGSGLAATSIRRKVAAARSYYRFLIEDGAYGESDPFLGMRLPKIPYRLPRVIGPAEFEEMILKMPRASVFDIRDHAILEMLFGAGLRVAEVAGLNITDVDLTQKRARVIGKGNKERVAIFGDPCAEAISLYIEVAREALGRTHAAALFLNSRGGRLSKNWIERMVAKRSEELLGLRITPHTLRHSFGSAMRNAGAQLGDISRMLGHARVDTTEQIYAHTDISTLERSYAASHPRARRAAGKLIDFSRAVREDLTGVA